jgi:predicted dehydrogenase
MEYQRDASRRIRIGVVGVGSHCYRNILPTLTFLPVELVAIADPDTAKAGWTARQYGAVSYTSATEMYAREKLEAVLLCVSPQAHPALAQEAFAAGLHVWMEKPAALRTSEVAETLAARGDRVCVVGYKKVFMPSVLKARELLAARPDQPLLSILGVYPISVSENGRDVLEKRLPSDWLANGCHPLSVLLSVAGPAVSVTVHRGPGGAGGACVVAHENGVVSNLHLAQGGAKFQPFERYHFYAGDRAIEIENARRLSYQRGIKFQYATDTSFAPPGTEGGAVVWEAQDGLNTLDNKAVFTQGVWGELDHFCSAILAGKQATEATLEFALNLTRVYEGALLSNGNTVRIGSGE